ncbi:MAG: hypothetical protein C0169_05310 [Thermodesulfobacterium geofontis]|uniref:Uncharacterized protein n=1 Tax=Thermodesulfobacterium geofontis TaxID=1295609 RepID=A0A2N7QB08_9BACT|nr:MAG: hypothetical protein C0169_05310 [Thermodesulfobacterium geofontis]
MERNLTKDEAKERLINAFLEFAYSKNKFDWIPNWFIRYAVARDFQIKSFDKFVDFMYEKHYDMLIDQEKLYNEQNYSFFSKWNGLYFEFIELDPKYMQSFMEEFIAEEDKEDFIYYVRKNHCYVRMMTVDEAKEKVAKTFISLSKDKAFDSKEEEWFIEWNIENNFRTKSFDDFVEWLYYYEPHKLEDYVLWDFDGFVDEDEKKAFSKWIKKKQEASLSK